MTDFHQALLDQRAREAAAHRDAILAAHPQGLFEHQRALNTTLAALFGPAAEHLTTEVLEVTVPASGDSFEDVLFSVRRTGTVFTAVRARTRKPGPTGTGTGTDTDTSTGTGITTTFEYSHPSLGAGCYGPDASAEITETMFALELEGSALEDAIRRRPAPLLERLGRFFRRP